MCWLKSLISIFTVIILIIVVDVQAQEEAKPTKDNKASVPAEPVEKDYSGHQTEEWMAVQTQLTTMKGKVENQKKLVESLIQQKEIATGAEQAEKIEELKKAHLEYIRVIESYNQISTTFQTKYPEKGGTIGRVYKRIDPANIESLKNKMSAEGRLQKLNKTIEKQYSKNPAPSDRNKSAIVPKKSGKKVIPDSVSEPVEKVKDVQVTDQIILQK